MSKAPSRCPMCGESLMWKKVDVTKRALASEKLQSAQSCSAQSVWLAAHSERKRNATAAENAVFSMNIDSSYSS